MTKILSITPLYSEVRPCGAIIDPYSRYCNTREVPQFIDRSPKIIYKNITSLPHMRTPEMHSTVGIKEPESEPELITLPPPLPRSNFKKVKEGKVNKICHNLKVGDRDFASNLLLLKKHKIDSVITIGNDSGLTKYEKKLCYKTFNNPEQSREEKIVLCVGFVKAIIHQNYHNVLFYCEENEEDLIEVIMNYLSESHDAPSRENITRRINTLYKN